MEERGNKTIMCSVLFLDIVEYSKKSVAGQISLKDRFNEYLSAAISNVPIADRIILDTGDGAAINFLSDVEDALKAALSLRESMLNEDPNMDPPLHVRAGINLGPVRLVRDINGQPNIVGDGINVAQRVMGFADTGQILVSRSYYDAVSRLSPQYAGMFHYQGSRTDKHVREHEVYAIGYPGDKAILASASGQAEDAHADVSWSVKLGLNVVVARLAAVAQNMADRFRQADSRQRALYIGAIVAPVLLIGALMLKPAHKIEAPAMPDADQILAASGVEPAGTTPEDGVPEEGASSDTANAQTAVEDKPDKANVSKKKTSAARSATGGKTSSTTKKPAVKPKTTESILKSIRSGTDASDGEPKDATISIVCPEGTQLFVDGAEKGKVVAAGLSVSVPPGKHKVIITSKSGDLYSENVELGPGKTVRIKPGFCN